MAAFSDQHLSFLLDPSFLPNSTIKMPGLLEEPNTTTATPTTCFSQFYPSPESLPLHQSSCLENVTKSALTSNNNEPSSDQPNYKHNSTDSSSVVLDYKPETGEQVTQKVMTPMDKKRKNREGSAQSKGPREVKGKKQKKCNGVIKDGKAANKPKADKKGPEEAQNGYIHVRARRGQATDSHSLAERVRREKISERMKLLQSLVPGCDKVTGKALMLDEIINYVQSLQSQVEFLSMKLASMNPMFYDFGMELDAFMVTPERLNGLVSPLPNMQECNPVQAAATTVFSETTPNSYHPLLDSASSLLFQQGQMPNLLPQENGQLLWDVADQRQKLVNQCGFNNNLRSFH